MAVVATFRAGLVAAIAVATSAACLLTVSTSGLSGGGVPASEEASPRDVASDADDISEAGTDASSDAGFPDGSTVWAGNGHAYKIVIVDGGLGWDDARNRAQLAGGHLATLGTADENSFVTAAVLAFGDAALNMNRVGPWLGGHQPSPTSANEPAGGWEWIDGTPWSFTAWCAGQPDNSGNAENYLDFYNPAGTLGWNDEQLGGTVGPPPGYVIEFE